MTRWLRSRLLHLATLGALLAAVGYVSLGRKLPVLGADIGWHLKTGDWIVEHRAFPHTGIFSRTAATHPWAAYSWGYELLLSRSYAWFGLVGIGAYGMALTVFVFFCVFWMARRLSGKFWLALALAVACCYSILLLRIVPRPAFFSIALFCVVLTWLFEAQRSGRVQTLYWLPAVFLVWANLHIQFIYGLGAVGLLLAINIAQEIAHRAHLAPNYIQPRSLPSGGLALVFALCVLATLAGPYSYHLYSVIYQYSQAKVPYAMVQELQPFRLRFYANYVQLLLAAAAFAAVGFQKRLDVFKLALLAVATVFAVRTMRDAWFECTVATACLAEFARPYGEVEAPETRLQLAGVFSAVAVLLFILARPAGFTEQRLQRAVAAMYPVDAVHFLQQNPVPGPLWNIFDWGGFLVWNLPEYPVGIDPRTDLYGDELLARFHHTELGDADYRSDPYLNDAGVVLLRPSDALTPLLESDPRFRRVYEDKIAAVFVRR